MKIKKFDGGLLTDQVYVGIDQSYSGFAITLLDKTTLNHQTTVYKSEETGIRRLKEIQAHVMDTLVDWDIQDVAMEGYAFGSQMANMLGELGGMVKLTLLDFGVYPLIVPPTNLKKYVTGKGNGVPKSQMLLYVYKKWGVEFTDDNAADSYSLARLVAGVHSLEYEKDVYDKLQDPKFREK
jgi:Holliday junction resolvasome RuvABC endonuclease subunit